MSRGFVKEDDLEHAGTDSPERPVSVHANYVTPQGLLELTQSAQRLELERQELAPLKEDPIKNQRLTAVERDLRYVQARLNSVILVEPPAQATETVLFGANVVVEDEHGEAHHFKIVGEDEANIAANKVSYVSPISVALLGRKIGDSVLWQRPAGNVLLEILNINY